MEINKKKISNINLLIIFLLILALLSYVIINKFQKDKDQALALEPISINLLTSVHPDLSWNFQPVEPKIVVIPGEVITVEYIVENLGNIETTGIATFVYFPNQFGNYISKINCFCYDAQTLKPKEKSKYTLVLLIDPEATKDSKTKNIKEVTIQFTFFDYKEYKKQKS
jgi:cytochrome c oxidase assembly protein subunit 11